MGLPASFRAGGWFANVDASNNITQATGKPRLIIAQKTAAGSATVDTLVQVTRESQAISLFGQGSHAHLMCKRALANNRTVPLWVIPVADDGSAVSASATITVTVTTAEAGTISLYIAGQKVTVTVADGDLQNDIASAIEAAIDAALDLPVTASVATNVVTVTAKNGGTLGNAIDIRENYYGVAGGEVTPTGVSLAIVAMSSGATDPSLTNAIAAMGDVEFDFISIGFTGATELNAIGAEMDDSDSGRWGQLRQIYGHVFTAKVDTLSNLTTLGGTRNDPHVSIAGLASCPSPPWEIAAALMSVAAGSLSERPANPIAKTALSGIIGPAPSDRFTAEERSTLLNSGIATLLVSDAGVVRCGICATTYQEDALGNPDDAYYQVQTPTTNARILRLFKARSAAFDEFVVVDDLKRVRAGVQKVTTVDRISKYVFIGGYADAIGNGWAENMDAFKAALSVTMAGSRITANVPPDLANPLRQWDVTLAFRLDF
jgi:phage tail sheath gpL-like